MTTSVYDADNRLTRKEFTDGTNQLRADYAYTARDQVESITRHAALAGDKVSSTLYTYDGQGRITNLKHRDETDTVLANYTYTYDLSDRLLDEQRNGVIRGYEYNLTNELTKDGTATFAYDLAGNRDTHVIGPNNRLLSDGVFTYTYDGEGNQVERKRLDNTDVWLFTYDHNNQLIKAEHKPTTAGSVDQRITFEYDVFQNRVIRTDDSDGDGAGTAAVEKFAYDGPNAWADLDGSSSLTTLH